MSFTESSSTGDAWVEDEPLEVCVLADPRLYQWQVDALDHALESGDATLSLLVVNQPADADPVQEEGVASTANPGSLGLHDLSLFVRMLRRERAWALVLAERKLGWVLDPPNPLYDATVPVGTVDCLDGVDRIDCTPVEDGVWNELPDEVVDRIAADADVVVRYGFGLLRGRVLSATDGGVLSFHPADVRKYRGLGPSRQWLEDDDVAAATLQRLDDSIDGGRVVALEQVDASDAATLHEVENRVYERQTRMLATGLRHVADPTFTPTTVPSEDLGVYTPIARRRDVDYAGGILLRNLRGRVHRGLRRTLQRFRVRAFRRLSNAKQE